MVTKGFVVGLVMGLGLACVAQARPDGRQAQGEADHYEMGWTVLAGGKVICVGPFVRPSEREIECRSARVRLDP